MTFPSELSGVCLRVCVSVKRKTVYGWVNSLYIVCWIVYI